MRSGKSAALLGISFAILVAIGGAAWAGEFADCVRETASKDLMAKREFQRGLRDLIVQNRPEFESLATVNMELQILLAEARRAMLEYLLANDPGRIDTTNGLGRFSNFDWSEEDSAELMEESASYRDLDNRLSRLRDRNNGHPGWPELRAYVRSELGQSPDFKALTARLQSRQSEVEAVIAQCRHD